MNRKRLNPLQLAMGLVFAGGGLILCLGLILAIIKGLWPAFLPFIQGEMPWRAGLQPLARALISVIPDTFYLGAAYALALWGLDLLNDRASDQTKSARAKEMGGNLIWAFLAMLVIVPNLLQWISFGEFRFRLNLDRHVFTPLILGVVVLIYAYRVAHPARRSEP
ncbi:hypothetical protein [Woodsholea maritima]|uniref:hypothetical protein n=1 Tax=Woodsholea maritima TaxID=240237 RepID=UPI00037422DE|nr:hypothetical protein [Woodsholea maritima]